MFSNSKLHLPYTATVNNIFYFIKNVLDSPNITNHKHAKISIAVRHVLRYFKLITLNENYDDSKNFSQGVTTTTKFYS